MILSLPPCPVCDVQVTGLKGELASAESRVTSRADQRATARWRADQCGHRVDPTFNAGGVAGIVRLTAQEG